MQTTILKNAGTRFLSCCAFSLVLIFISMMQNPEEKKPLTYLALGDSYTIGEKVPRQENYPSKTVALLEQEDVHFSAPEIVAETGWTTTDLSTAISKTKLLPRYDFVTLLIGVNNQYQNLETSAFVKDFETLLKKAIRFAGNDTGHVVVLSIPDWSVTPYAKNFLPDRFGRDAGSVSKQIDEFNAACRLISGKHHVAFVDITEGTRLAAEQPDLLTSDGLHPSAKEYSSWAEKLSTIMKRKFR